MCRRFCLSLIAVLVFARAVFASAAAITVADSGWTANGLRICPTVGTQISSTFTTDGTGGAYIGWWDTRSGTYDVYLQRLSSAGVPAAGWPVTGLLIRANASDLGHQPEPARVVSDGAGGVLIAWFDNRAHSAGVRQDIYAQRVDPSGTMLWTTGGVRVTSSATAYSCYDMTSDGAGGALFSWEDQRLVTTDLVYAQRIDGSGQPLWAAGGVSATTDMTSLELCPTVAPDGVGGAVVSWQGHNSSISGTFAQKFSSIGTREWPDSGLAADTTSSYYQYGPQLIPDGTGGAILSVPGRLRRWNASATLLWSVPLPFSSSGGARVSILPDGTGGAIAAWANNVWYPTADSSIYVEHYSSTGSPQWSWPRVCADARAGAIAMTSDGAGGAFLVWQDGRSGLGTSPPDYFLNIYAQHVTSSGTIPGSWPTTGLPLCTADSAQKDPSIIPDGVGGAILLWTDWRNPQTDLYAARITGGGVVPTLLSLESVVAEPGHVHLRWLSADGGEMRAEVDRADAGADSWRRIGTVVADGTGELSYDDNEVLSGHRYGYRLSVPDGGIERFLGETWVEVPRGLHLALELAGPNPGRGRIAGWVTLTSGAPATLELLDVSGRRIATHDVSALGPGRHNFEIAPNTRLSAGIYSLRLIQGGRSVRTSVVVLR